MYRAPEAPPPRCPSCGSASLSPETRLDPSEGYLRVHFHVAGGPPGLLGGPTESFVVDRARVCLGCGHVMTGLSARTLAQLRARLGQLAPMAG